MKKTGLLVALVLSGLSLPASADALDVDGYRFNAGISWLSTTGNSESSSFGLASNYERKQGDWRYLLIAGALEASEGGETVAEAFTLGGRASRLIRDRLSITGGILGEQNRFAGIDFRSTVDLGADWRAIDREDWSVNAIAAATYNMEELTDGSDQEYAGALLAVRSVWDLSETASSEQSIRFEPNFDDTDDYRIDAQVGLKADLTGLLALKVSYGLRYDAVPVPGFESTDTIATASVVFELERLAGGGVE
ncbi:MAG: DUF481 domain-containing protein [Acidobacteria bacterium]|nr:DUF481 domain-containing protein [Acidobacteriota bacterium]